VPSLEESIIDLFETNNHPYKFDSELQLLTSEHFNILLLGGKSTFSSEGETDNCADEEKLTLRIWQDVYHTSPKVVNSRILSLLGMNNRIFGRSTLVKDISQEEMNSFLISNHLNKTTKIKHRYGLFEKNGLVAVAGFGRSCPIQMGDQTYRSHELIRYCSTVNHTVVGGLSKLIKHFGLEHQPEHLMTYVDREWSHGKSYLQLGFKVEAVTKPKIFWVSTKSNRRITAREYLEKLENKTLIEAVWKRIENLGNIKLVKIIV